jgi:AcrR family transcriptional regulator
MEDSDQKIIRMTVKVAGESEANRFSTREVASRLGISEYMIYDHFHDKDNLLNLADQAISEDYYHDILEWGPKSKSFAEFFSHLLDGQIRYHDNAAFALNYCRVFPRYEKASDFALFKNNCEAVIAEVFRFFPLQNKDDSFPLWCYFTREFTYDAQLLIAQHIPDTPENRLFMANLIYQGFGAQERKWDGR